MARVAFLRTHKRSPFWFLKRRNLDTGVWEERSTGMRVSDAAETRKAQRAADKASAAERQIGAPGSSPAFASWVPSYLATHWQNRPSSTKRYSTAWRSLRTFLDQHDIVYPRQIKFGHGESYIHWRRQNAVNGKSVGHNTALLEIKFLAQLMREAIRREFAESNPLDHLGIARAPQKVKPELTDAQIKKLRRALGGKPQWMRTVFEIGLYTGCRFSEAAIPMNLIDFRSNSIRLRDAKRNENDPRKHFTIPLPEELRPLLKRLKQEGLETTCTLSEDKNGRINYLFRKAGIAASFHSLRVTFVTRCHRAGLSESEAMRLVNHSSKLVHQIYSRLNVQDVRSARRRVRLPPAAQ